MKVPGHKEDLFAAIDIGTNTLRLLIGSVNPSGSIKTMLKERVITRLGGGFEPGTGISRDAFLRNLDAIRYFSNRISSFPIREMRAVGTSVLRKARNRDEFITQVFRETGVKIEVITGEEEALFSLKGVLTVIGKERTGLIIDVGGGSTEYIFCNKGNIEYSDSLDLGVVTMSEAFLKLDPPCVTDLKKMEDSIGEIIMGLHEKIGSEKIDASTLSEEAAIFVGTAGTPTTLSAIDQSLEVYDPERVNGYILSKERLGKIYSRLCSLTLKEREKIIGLEKGREDVIIPGTYIILKTMDIFGFQRMMVSDAGLLEGILLKLWEDDRLFREGVLA